MKSFFFFRERTLIKRYCEINRHRVLRVTSSILITLLRTIKSPIRNGRDGHSALEDTL